MTPEDRAAAMVQRANGERSAQGIPTNTTDAANTVYHGSRHTEQWYRMARLRSGLGDSPDQVAQTMGIPANIATQAAADPILQCDAEESDAWSTGAEISESYPGGTDARNLQTCDR